MDFSLIPPDELIIMYPKMVESFFFLLIAFMVKNRGGRSFKEQYYLNRTFFYAFLSWFVYISLDIVIFLFAAISFDPNIATPPGGVTGYPLAYPSLFITQILRDVGMAGGILNMLFLLVAAYQIRHGLEETKVNLTHNPFALVLMIVFLVVADYFDQIMVIITPGQVALVTAQFSGMGLFALAVEVAVYFVSAFMLRRAMFRDTSGADPSLLKRLRFISWGVLLMGIGDLYWVVEGALWNAPSNAPNFLLLQDVSFLLLIIGHVIWTLSPILVYLGLRRTGPEKEPQVAPAFHPLRST